MIEGAVGAEQNKSGGLISNAAAHLDAALSRLEQVWHAKQEHLIARINDKEQRAEQQIQTLRVQASHWKAEAERLSTQVAQQGVLQQRAQKAEQELSYHRQRAHQWHEKAESWKEEARRSEEARVAALHKSNSPQMKRVIQELDACLDETIESLKEVIETRTGSFDKIAEGGR